ncbi:sugar transporter SWEET1-like isoform X2 [Daktulosphaira vitifoliae]|nr:sugar transporter SWEET1-like isoform X2 [Daktulosphaira vitifoliae]XP_050531038.1 sugar transporter SWEET1-like isoform X2 [Daktulosphaira vitifoliae]XP_050531039.1 sugar transporter SWEET1-like isoform X2 [Daktulosphaira vitifoliae]XP_050531040.1 sugar transporter SWEET1-like isoform X2 [Daktulosphaira vitifoliae]
MSSYFYADYEYVLSVSAAVSTYIQFLSGFLICLNFMKKGKVINESVFPFITGFLSCSLWLYYGVLKTNGTIIFVNTFGCLLFLMYTSIYFKYSPKKNYVVNLMLLAVIIILLVYTDVQTEQVSENALHRVGLACCIMTMLFFAAPLSNLVHVIRVRNSESLPLPLIIMTFLVSTQWLVYGKMLRDKFIMYPNAVGCALSAIQLILFIVYPRKPSDLNCKLMDA